MPRLIRVFAGRTVILLVLSCAGSLILHLIDHLLLDNNTCVTPLELAQFTQAVIEAYNAGVMTSQKKHNATNWDYDSAVFFAVTVITAIGKLADFTRKMKKDH